MSRNFKNQRNSHSRPRYDDIDPAPPTLERFFQPDIQLVPRNQSQKKYLEALQDASKTVVIGVGPAGTGKTYMAVMYAVKQLLAGSIKKIILIRPVETPDGSNPGALPGGIIEKYGPYLGEALSLLKDALGVKTVIQYLEDEIIEILPLAFARGRSLRDAMIIVEECQDIDDHVVKLLLTRIANHARMFINGDISQADTDFNGLEELLYRIEEYGETEHFSVCWFYEKDVVRHPVITEVLKIYRNRETKG